MRRLLTIIFGLGLLAALPARAATGLKLEFTARDLAPGSHVWVEVRPTYHQLAIDNPLAAEEQESSALEQAQGELVWHFEVPPSGNVSPMSHNFAFAADLDRTSSDHLGVIHLKTRFRVDGPAGQQRTGYGEVHEITLAMAVLPGNAPLARCLRLREVGDRLIAESAPNCLDTSFTKSTKVIHLQAPVP
jgi:hypothetical protein